MRVLLGIVVASWEIECCAPPPVVGGTTTWTLTFSPDPDGAPWPGRAEHHVRAVGDGRVVVDGVVPAHWREAVHGATPASVRCRGELHGTAHGGIVPDDLPAVTGRVERVRVMRTRYRRVGADERSWWEPVPGSTTLTDVRESPRWFARSTTGLAGPHEDGVLVDVHIPVEAPEPSS